MPSDAEWVLQAVSLASIRCNLWGILSCGGNSAVVVVTVLLVESPLLVMVRAAVLSKSSGILRDDV